MDKRTLTMLDGRTSQTTGTKKTLVVRRRKWRVTVFKIAMSILEVLLVIQKTVDVLKEFLKN